jgi:hypothetical protein
VVPAARAACEREWRRMIRPRPGYCPAFCPGFTSRAGPTLSTGVGVGVGVGVAQQDVAEALFVARWCRGILKTCRVVSPLTRNDRVDRRVLRPRDSRVILRGTETLLLCRSPPMTTDFTQGAVRTPTDYLLMQHLSELERAVPEAKAHREAFRQLGSEFVYARRVGADPAFRQMADAWAVLVRFGLVMETTFGLTREVLLLYSPHRDLQIRSYNALPVLLASLPRDVTPGVALVSTPDPRQAEKLDDWSDLYFTAIPIPVATMDSDQHSRGIIRSLEQRLFSRDLYAETAPVTGPAFFGRQIMLQSLLDDVRSHRVPGLFGLRKSGKTSVLKKLGETLLEDTRRPYVFVLRDLESLPSLPRPVIRPLIFDLRESILAQLRQRGFRTRELAEMVDGGDLLEFRRALQTLLNRAGETQLHVVVALDEVEYLCPPDQVDVETPETQEVTQFFRALRSLVQETRNFTFVIAGLASASIEAGTLFGRPNPLFSWAKPYYVPPFSAAESESLLITLGRRMGLVWDKAAGDEVFETTGGHPYLLRDLASAVTRRLPLRAAQRRVTRGEVHKRVPQWRRATAGNVKEMLSHVERFYPTEAVLLDILEEDPAGFEELAREDPQAVHHLLGLGLVTENETGRFEISRLVFRRH